MKINSIRISNILSFKHEDNIENSQEIQFNDNLNILIGPNGSGKSNFLEILNKILKQVFFVPCRFKEEQKARNETNPSELLNKTIEFMTIPPTNLVRNRNSTGQLMKIRIVINLTKEDCDNLKFIQDNIKDIEYLSRTYSAGFPIAEVDVSGVNFNSIDSITIDITEQSGGIFDANDIREQPARFVLLYLRWYNFIQNLVIAGILWESKKWDFLKNSFAMANTNRNFYTIETKYSIAGSSEMETKSRKFEAIKSRLMEENVRFSDNLEPPIFELVKHIIAVEYKKLISLHGTAQATLSLQNYPVFKGINESLEKTIGIRFEIAEDSSGAGYVFSFKKLNENRIVNTSELSSGEKGIIYFIFILYGSELHNGLFIVDEPELHIHPQLQEKIYQIIKNAMDVLKLQVVIATHSPIFVIADTIEGVHRFYIENGYTQTIIHPKLPKDTKDRVQMLTYTNSTKIFFSKKVILVEGDADQFFYQKYLRNFQLRKNRDISDIEFLNMGGANRFEKWDKLLKSYKIKVYYIGDSDNLLRDYVSANSTNWMKLVGAKLLQQQIQNLKTNAKTDYDSMMSEIAEKYSKNIFLLSNGKTEEYFQEITGIMGDVDRITEFCNCEFDRWIDSGKNSEIKDELDYFFHCITISN